MKLGWVLAFLLAAPACSSGGEPDAGASLADADPVQDAALGPALCPSAVSPACQRAADCQPPTTPPTNCAFCRPYDRAICAAATCRQPDPLTPADLHTLRFEVGTLRPQVVSLAGFVLAAETAGGARVGCSDVYGPGGVDLGNGCYNLLDARGADITQPSDLYMLSFSGFAGGQHALLIVYGFSMPGAKGPPLGVSCTEIDVGLPGSGVRTVPGDKMRVLE